MTIPSQDPPAPRKKAGLLKVMWIIFSGFIMIGRNRDYDANAPKITPGQIVVGAIIGAALFVGGLITLVSFIVRSSH